MKHPLHPHLRILLPMLCLGALAGCAENQSIAVLPTVKPDRPAYEPPAGTLVVNSATREYNSGDIPYYPHTEYAIYRMDGTLLRYVENHLGLTDENAARVELPPGSYRVKAESETEGPVLVPVVIRTGRTTTVELERRRQTASSRYSMK